MAFTKKEKIEMMSIYENWLSQSEAVFLLEYNKMTMKDVDDIRAKAREAGGEMHVVKNTLFGRVLDQLGINGEQFLEKTSLVGFAFKDAPALAKVVSDAAKLDQFQVKGGLMGKRMISTDEVKALASTPPLPVVRAQLLGLINMPATQLVRTINEPARGLASVVRAYTEKEGTPEAAAA